MYKKFLLIKYTYYTFNITKDGFLVLFSYNYDKSNFLATVYKIKRKKLIKISEVILKNWFE